MSIKSRHLALVAVVAGAVAPATAVARPDIGPLPFHQAAHSRLAVPVHCGKDYSRNSVTGDYCDPVTAGHVAPVSAPSTPAPSPLPVATSHDSGFSWSDAGAGAGGAVALIAAAAGGAIALRRRSAASIN